MASDVQGEGTVQMQVDVGAGVMMQAEAARASSVLVDVGLGFRVECDIAEAQDITALHVSTAQVTELPSHTPPHAQELWPPYTVLNSNSSGLKYTAGGGKHPLTPGCYP